ncbi:bZIP transcription factor [Aspergillus sp. HF37]|nr:bZIP transcription factor [Aspergillus sp. HF37]
MTEYNNARRFPNFSQYLDDLNTIPSPYDQAAQQQQQQDSFNIDAELSLFTNAEFFDFDNFGDLSLPTFDSVEDGGSKKEGGTNAEQKSDMKFMDLLSADGLQNGFSSDLNNPNPAANTQTAPAQNPAFSSIQPAVPSVPVNDNASQPSAPPASSPTKEPESTSAPKRRQSQKSGPGSVEEASRVIAEEDKRRRNTAASARFRVKKKQREQSLEKTVKDTSARNNALEARVSQLELENQWLKNLVTEKGDGKSGEGRKSESDIANMFKKFLASQKEGGQSGLESKSGVGTGTA